MLNLRLRLLHCCAVLLTAGVLLGSAQAATPKQLNDFFHSVELDDAQTVKTMLRAGIIDPNAVNPVSGEPGLVTAMREGANRVLKVFLANPATNLELNAANGNTALMMAAFKHNKEAVLALLDKGAVVNRPGWTALHYAAAAGDDEIAKILLDNHAYIDASAPAKFTPLMIAAREGNDSTVKLLMEEGADASLKNSEGLTAAQIAQRADKRRIADLIAAQLAARK